MENTKENKKKKRLIMIIVGALLLIGVIIGLFFYYNAITAVTMRIQRLVGTVNLYNEEGAEQSLREKMRLGAGQTVTTAGESLIMVSLDDTKLMTMEESSRAEIKARGKKLLFNLIEGNLFFNVTEKLADNESFDVTTTTMVCGIRGTSAYVGRDSTSHEILMVTDGLVHVIATNPVTKEQTEVDVPAGQMITIYLDEEAEGNKTISIRMASFREEDLPAMALDTMAKNKELMARVASATGFSPKKLATLAELSSVKGISMYGSAAAVLAAEGIDDSIPFMGDRSKEMIISANSAVNIAGDDLPLEVAIIQGYRDVLDVATEAGYDSESMTILMDGTRECVEETFKIVDVAGIRSVDRLKIATRLSDTLKKSARSMTSAGLSTKEIEQVLDATTKLYTEAVQDAAGTTSDGSRGDDVVAAVNRVSDHVVSTIDEEMSKASDGDETVIALLGLTGIEERKSSDADTETVKENETDENTNNKQEEGTSENTGNGGSSNSTGKASSPNTGGATPQERKAAAAAIIARDPNTGIVALADGTLFDPTYYAAANPDVVEKYGTDTESLLAEWLKEGKAQGRPPIAPCAVATTQEKPDWLLRQEQEEREQQQHEPEESSSSGSSSGGSGGGGGPVNYTPDGQGNVYPPGGATVNYDPTNKDISITSPGTVTLPISVSGTKIEDLSKVTNIADGTTLNGVKNNSSDVMSAVTAEKAKGNSVTVSNGTTTVSGDAPNNKVNSTVTMGKSNSLSELTNVFNSMGNTNGTVNFGSGNSYTIGSPTSLTLGGNTITNFTGPNTSGTKPYFTDTSGTTPVDYYINNDGSISTTP